MTPLRLAIGSIFLGIAVLALKSAGWWITGSVALLSDALESTVNVATACAAALALRVAARPADASHPYGHHKAEFFSAVLEGVMIVLAAILILWQAAGGLMEPAPVAAPLPGLLVNLLATAANLAWARLLIARGDMLRSPALMADGRHLMADVVTSVGVAAGLGFAILTGWWILDPLLAAMVALNVLWSGWGVMRDSFSGLMDAAAPQEVQDRLHAIIASEGGGAMQAHDLRTRRAGQATFLDFHLVVPGKTTVFDAHEICDRLERALADAEPGLQVTIHVEPEHESTCETEGAIALDCPEKGA